MRNKALLVLSWILFVLPIVIIISRYETERTVEVEKGMGLIPTLIVGFVALAILGFIISNFKKILQDDKFGTLSTLTYLAIALLLTSFGYVTLSWVINAAEANVTAFTDNMQYHLGTFKLIMFSYASGIIVLVINLWLNFKK